MFEKKPMNMNKLDDTDSPAQNSKTVEDPDDLPDVKRELPELRIYSHSPIYYWWPVWVTGYIMAVLSMLSGKSVRVDGNDVDWILGSANPGIAFVAILLMVIVFTNVKLRGIYSVVTVLGLAFIAVLLAWLGWWDEILSILPELSVRMNMGFYLVFSSVLLIIWLLSFLVFDRLRFWRIRPGQMTEERIIGGGERSYDTHGMLFEKHGEDVFQHVILGLGAGDLKISTTGARKAELYIPNVLFVDKKVRAIQKLIAVKPDDLLETENTA